MKCIICGRPTTFTDPPTCSDDCYLRWLHSTPAGQWQEYQRQLDDEHNQRREDSYEDDDSDPWGF